MRYDITNIPIAEVFEEGDGCPICRLRNTLEKLVQEQANRLAGVTGEITREMLCEITRQDALVAIHGEDAAKPEETKPTEGQN